MSVSLLTLRWIEKPSHWPKDNSGVNRQKMSDQQELKAKGKKKAYLSQTIMVGLKPKDATAEVMYEKVPRGKMSVEHINKTFRCNADFIQDQFGGILWPEDWLKNVFPNSHSNPWYYTIIEKEIPDIIDAAHDEFYNGGTMLRMVNVPIECTEDDIRYWIKGGIADGMSIITNTKNHLKKVESQKEFLQKKIDKIPQMQIAGDTLQEIQRVRQGIARVMEKKMAELDEIIGGVASAYKRRMHILTTEPVILRVLEEHRLLETVSWEVQFPGPLGEEMLERVMLKPDWRRVLLTHVPEAEGAAKLTDGTSGADLGHRQLVVLVAMDRFREDAPPEAKDNEINMRNVEFQRVRHGKGVVWEASRPHLKEERALRRKQAIERRDNIKRGKAVARYDDEGSEPADSDESWVSDDDYEMHERIQQYHEIDRYYDGEWKWGQRHGEAVSFEVDGKYTGRWGGGKKVEGVLDCSNGDRFEGTFGCDPVYESPITANRLYHTHPYHGEGVWTFADGSRYEGDMKDGRVTGRGRYYDQLGNAFEGDFLDGELHGRGKFVAANGDEHEGLWRHGRPHGPGVMRRMTASLPKRKRPEDEDFLGKRKGKNKRSGEWATPVLASGRADYEAAIGMRAGVGAALPPIQRAIVQARVKAELEAAAEAPFDLIRGVWEDGELEGRATVLYGNGNSSSNMYMDGLRVGFGSLRCGNARRTGSGGVRARHDYEYEGDFRAGRIKTRGVLRKYDQPRQTTKTFTVLDHQKQPENEEKENEPPKSAVAAAAAAAEEPAKMESKNEYEGWDAVERERFLFTTSRRTQRTTQVLTKLLSKEQRKHANLKKMREEAEEKASREDKLIEYRNLSRYYHLFDQFFDSFITERSQALTDTLLSRAELARELASRAEIKRKADAAENQRRKRIEMRRPKTDGTFSSLAVMWEEPAELKDWGDPDVSGQLQGKPNPPHAKVIRAIPPADRVGHFQLATASEHAKKLFHLWSNTNRDFLRELLEKNGLNSIGVKKHLATRLTLSRIAHPLLPPLSEEQIADGGAGIEEGFDNSGLGFKDEEEGEGGGGGSPAVGGGGDADSDASALPTGAGGGGDVDGDGVGGGGGQHGGGGVSFEGGGE